MRKEDYENYAKLMVKTNALYRDNNPKRSHPKSSKSDKWNLIRLIWAKRGGMRERESLLFRVILTRCQKDLIFYLQVKKRVIQVSEMNW